MAATKRIIVESRGWSDEEMWDKQTEILAPVFMSNDAKEGAIALPRSARQVDRQLTVFGRAEVGKP